MTSPTVKGTIVVAGSLAQSPGMAGHTIHFLQYGLGLRRLGWDMLYIDRLEPGMCVDEEGRPSPVEGSYNLAYIRRVLEGLDFEESYVLLDEKGVPLLGRSRRAVEEALDRSAFLLNIMGFLQDPELRDRASSRVFLDVDPGFGQIWKEQGLADIFEGHDRFVTLGQNIGDEDCSIPTCGIDWITTPPPVDLDFWSDSSCAGDAFSTVASWRGTFGPLEHHGRKYGLRVHEFRKFASLPARTGQCFRLALDIDPKEKKDIAMLNDNGWSRVDPKRVAGDPWAYRDFIRSSLAEFQVAKNMYVDCRSGWISDRSLAYLASGRPVIAQDTGFRGRYGGGEGLLPFSSLDEAVEAVERVAREPARHAKAARRLAEAHFDSDKVLGRLLERLGV